MSSYPEKTGHTEGQPSADGQPATYNPPSGYSQPSGYAQPPGYVQPSYGQQPGYGPPAGQPGYPSNTVVVQQPGQFVVQPTGIRPSDYLVLSIVAIFFCWPMAICAIVYSCNSKSSSDAGDYPRAESQGRTARNIGIAAIVIGIVIVIVAVVVNFVVAAAYVAAVCQGIYC